MNPGQRLIRARMLNGYKHRKDLFRHLQKIGLYIDYNRLGRLERNNDNPTILEINILCEALRMSADWWLRSHQASSQAVLRRLDQLDNRKRSLILCIIEEISTPISSN